MLPFLLFRTIQAFLPSFNPTDYPPDTVVPLSVNVLSAPSHSLLNYDQYTEKLHFCRPLAMRLIEGNIGTALFGDRLFESPISLSMTINQTCVDICSATIPVQDVGFVRDRIEESYMYNWILDQLPIGTPGFALGKVINGSIFLHNHYEFTVLYHPHGLGHRVVGASVVPSSWDGDCSKTNTNGGAELVDGTERIVKYSYSVNWIQSEIEWGSRLDHYLMNSSDPKIHWFSVVNSMIVVVLLTGIVVGILVGTLKRDILRYNGDLEESMEEFGWKLVHGDVFRPPRNRMALSVFTGNGCQILGMAGSTLLMAAGGLLSPFRRGSLVTAMVVMYAIFGGIAGYVSARIYKMCGGLAWRQNMLMTALLVPGVTFMMVLILNFLFIFQNSSSAIPFGSLVTAVALWLFLSIPLSFIGAYAGFRSEKISVPVRTLQIPRQVPEQIFYLKFVPAISIAGLLPFGALFIELLYILNSIWGSKMYYMFGFLLLVFAILIITTSQIAIIVCYIALCSENYHWPWRSFFAGASCGGYVFLYGAVYYYTHLQLKGTTSAIIYFCWTGAISAFLGLMTGASAYIACFLFVRKIYSAIKVD